MRKGHWKALTDKYGPAFLALVFLFLSYSVRGQSVYRPSNTGYFTPANKPYGLSTPVPTDGRTYKADSVNGLFRPYNGTAEALTYLPTGSQFRVGQFPIVINVGGSLQSNGLFVGGQIQVWWFLRGQADTNLVRMDSVASGTCPACLLKANNLSDVQSLFQTLINLNLNNVDNTSDATKNSATATLTNKSISGLTNTLTSIPNSALLNNSIGLTIDTAGSSPSVSPTPAALGTSLGLHIPWAGANSGLLKASAYAFFNGKLDSVHVSNDSVYNCVNGNCTLQSVIAGGTGAVLSVSNSDGSLVFSPTTGNVIGSINTAHGNTWTGQQTFNTAAPIFGTLTTNGGVFYGNGSGLLLQSPAGTSGQIFESQGSSGPIFFTPNATTVNGWLGYTPLSSALGSTHIFVGNGSNIATDVALTGDASISNIGVFTLATVNSNVGTFGSASSVAQFTTNAKGLTTAASSVAIQIAESQVTNLTSDLAGKQSTLSNTPSGGFPLFNLNASAIRELFAGTNVTIDSTTHTGGYTINASGGGGGTDSAVNPGRGLTQSISGTTKTFFADTSILATYREIQKNTVTSDTLWRIVYGIPQPSPADSKVNGTPINWIWLTLGGHGFSPDLDSCMFVSGAGHLQIGFPTAQALSYGNISFDEQTFPFQEQTIGNLDNYDFGCWIQSSGLGTNLVGDGVHLTWQTQSSQLEGYTLTMDSSNTGIISFDLTDPNGEYLGASTNGTIVQYTGSNGYTLQRLWTGLTRNYRYQLLDAAGNPVLGPPTTNDRITIFNGSTFFSSIDQRQYLSGTTAYFASGLPNYWFVGLIRVYPDSLKILRPPNFAAVAGGSAGTINITWSAVSNAAAGYELDRSTNPNFSGGVTVLLTGSTATSYSDSGLTTGTVYYYRLRASRIANVYSGWELRSATAP